MIIRPLSLRKIFGLTLFLGLAIGVAVPFAVHAVADESTYGLSDFKVAYPYDDPRPGEPDDRAAVTFDSHWLTGEFPGAANCHVSLQAADGAEVGALDFELLSGTDGATSGNLLVDVKGTPATAMGSCAGGIGEVAGGPGYVFSDPSVQAVLDPKTGEAIPSISELNFKVAWADQGSPGLRTCYVTIDRTEGPSDEPFKYNVLTGDDTSITFDVQGGPDTVSGGAVTCGRFEP